MNHDTNFQVGGDHVWLHTKPRTSVTTPRGKKTVEYSPTKIVLPIERCTFRTRFQGPKMGGDLVAQVSIAGVGRVERAIERDEIPNGTVEQCLEGYRGLLRAGFVSLDVDITTLELPLIPV